MIGPEAFEKLSPYFEKVLSGEKVRYEAEINLLGSGRQWITAIIDIDAQKQSEAALVRFQFSMEHVNPGTGKNSDSALLFKIPLCS